MALPNITALPTPPSRSDTPTNFNALADAFLNAFPTLRNEINAWAAALPANITGTDFSGTSTTSVAIAIGSQTFTTQTGKQFQIGQAIRIAYTTTPANYMDGQVTAYNSGTGALTVNVTAIGGTGTFALWTISLAVGGGGSNVTLTGSETLTNKTLTTPIMSGTASGTVAGRLGYTAGAVTYGTGAVQRTVANLDETQTFTNKTFDTAGGNVFKVNGNIFAAAAGTVTITFPAVTDTMVGRTTTDTLTNKTLTAPVTNGETNTGGTFDTAAIRANCTLNDTGVIGPASPGFRGMLSATLAGGAGRTDAAQIAPILADAGKRIPNSAGGWLIPANSAVAFPVDTILVFYNNSAAAQTLSITTDTLRLHGTATTGPRTIPQRGFCTCVKVSATEWVALGDVT